MPHVTVPAPATPAVTFGNDLPAAFILGPCVIESRDHALKLATTVAEIAQRVDHPACRDGPCRSLL